MQTFLSLFLHQLVFCLFFISNLSCYSQDESALRYYSKAKTGFYKAIGQSFSYPDRTKQGLLVARFVVFGTDVVEIEFIASPGKPFEEEFTRVLERTNGYWRTIDSIEMTIPIKFAIAGSSYYVDPYPKNYLSGVTCTAYGNSNTLPSDQELIETLNQKMIDKEYQEALDNLSILLRRNPLSLKLRESRVFCLNKLEMWNEACRDIDFIESVLNIKSKQPCLSSIR